MLHLFQIGQQSISLIRQVTNPQERSHSSPEFQSIDRFSQKVITARIDCLLDIARLI